MNKSIQQLESGHSSLERLLSTDNSELDFAQADLTKDNLMKYLIQLEVKHPLIVFSQAMLETQWLTCTSCSMDYNNLFGFGWNGKTYSKFKHWSESVVAYKEWQDKLYKGGDYLIFLNCLYLRSDGTCQSYAEDPNYVKRLKTFFKY